MPAHGLAAIPIDRLVYVCACVSVCLSVCLVFPFKITPSSPVMSQRTCAHKISLSPPPPYTTAVIVDVREHWQVWAQLCFSLSGACRAAGIQEWPGAAAAVTPGISFHDKPAREDVEVAGSRRPAGETCGGRSCGDWGNCLCSADCSALLPPYAGAPSRSSTPSRPHPCGFSRIVSHPYSPYLSDPSRLLHYPGTSSSVLTV